MTVKTQADKVTRDGNDSSTTFSFSPIVIFSSDDLQVVTTVTATGVETARTEGTGATNWSLGITTFPATGSIVYPADEVTPLPTGQTITVKRLLTLEQQLVLNNRGGYLPKNQETQFDKQVMIDIQQQEEIDRSFRLPVSYDGGASIEVPVPAASKTWAWNAAADAIEYLTPNSSTYLTLPASVTDNTLVRFNGTTGTSLKENATTITVAEGGTGAATLTDGGVLLGSGTGAITAMAVLTDGQMIVGDGTTDPVAESGATLRTSIGVAIGSDVAAYDADALFADTADTLTKGFNATENDAGTKTTGTFTPDPADGNFQKAVNGGAHTIAPPATTCSIVIQYTNNASAGAVTTSGFTLVDGDTISTTDADDFLFYVVRDNGFSHLNVKALQ